MPDDFWRSTPRTFAIAVGARMKANGDIAAMIGWNSEAFARTKRMKPLAEYLKPAPTLEAQREQGARDVRHMLDRMIQKQEGAELDKAGHAG